MTELDENVKVDLKKYKGHFRKFPWALIIRAIVAAVSIGIIIVMVQTVAELKEKKALEQNQDDFEIEVEY